MNQWFRMYSEFATDTKVQSMDEALQRRFVMMLCLQCSEELPKLNDEELAFALRITPAELANTRDVFKRKGFLGDNGEIRNWSKRQFTSDSSNDRVKRYRENRKALGLDSNGYTKHSVTVYKRDNNCCVYCGSNENLCVDHVLPTRLGGTDDIENLVTACKACNSGKSGRTPEMARYSWINKEAEGRWKVWMSRRVTVTETTLSRPQIQITDTDTDSERIRATAVAPPTPVEFQRLKNIFPKRAGDQPWPPTLQACNARLREGHTWAEILDGVTRYAAFCEATGKLRTETVMQAKRFCGPSKPFLNDWQLPATKAEAKQDKNISASQQWLMDQEKIDAAH